MEQLSVGGGKAPAMTRRRDQIAMGGDASGSETEDRASNVGSVSASSDGNEAGGLSTPGGSGGLSGDDDDDFSGLAGADIAIAGAYGVGSRLARRPPMGDTGDPAAGSTTVSPTRTRKPPPDDGDDRGARAGSRVGAGNLFTGSATLPPRHPGVGGDDDAAAGMATFSGRARGHPLMPPPPLLPRVADVDPQSPPRPPTSFDQKYGAGPGGASSTPANGGEGSGGQSDAADGQLGQLEGGRAESGRKQPPPLIPSTPLFDFAPDQASTGGAALLCEASGEIIPGLPAKTGTGHPVMPIHPKLTTEPAVLPGLEPLVPVPEDLVSRMLLHDAERMANPHTVMNRVVYDAIDPNPAAVKRAASAGSSGGEGGEGPRPDSPAAFAAHIGPPPPMSVEEQIKALSKPLTPYYDMQSENDTTLVFESRMESGNLRRAIQVYPHEYDLILRPDINTRGHTQWFYFSVSNTRRNIPYKLNVINLVKGDSLYLEGMQPLVFSEKESAASGTGWTRTGENICYYQNNIKRRNGQYYYTATFTLRFDHNHDTAHVAYCYPYTYTDLQRYLKALEDDPQRRQRFRRRPLCQTLAGNTCDLLTITTFDSDPEALRGRRGVVLSARVHPGESNSSWMMKGAIDFLTGNSLDAKILRDNFVFKVVPMLNPDGVINGNYRCSLAGVDLNRVWSEPNRKIHPTIYHTKQMIRRLMEDRETLLFCDMHGHSRKKNIFMYGCENKRARSLPIYDREGYNPLVVQGRLQEKVFPKILSENYPEAFSFQECNFKVQRSKESTARVVVWRELGLANSFTLEASFAGPSEGAHQGAHFSIAHLEGMGRATCEAILDYCDPTQSKVAVVYRELEASFPARDRMVGGTGILQGAPGFEDDESLAAGPGRERGAVETTLSGMAGVGTGGGVGSTSSLARTGSGVSAGGRAAGGAAGGSAAGGSGPGSRASSRGGDEYSDGDAGGDAALMADDSDSDDDSDEPVKSRGGTGARTKAAQSKKPSSSSNGGVKPKAGIAAAAKAAAAGSKGSSAGGGGSGSGGARGRGTAGGSSWGKVSGGATGAAVKALAGAGAGRRGKENPTSMRRKAKVK